MADGVVEAKFFYFLEAVICRIVRNAGEIALYTPKPNLRDAYKNFGVIPG